MVRCKSVLLLKTNLLVGMAFLLLTFLTQLSSATVSSAAYPEMPIPPPAGNCERCHDYTTHPMNNCNSCHDLAKYEPAATIFGGHGGLIVSDISKKISTAPVANCIVCHAYTNECQNCHPSYYGTNPPALITDINPRFPSNYTHGASNINRNYIGVYNTYQCEMCHVQKWWLTIPQHNNTTFGSVYDHQVNLDSRCGECHDPALTREHFRRSNPATGQPLDCFTCHSKADNQVQQAILAQNGQCNACHTQGHNLNMVPEVPGDVLKYPGLQWTSSLPLSLWQGEPWVEANPDDYRIIMSNRSKLSTNNVWTFYREGLTARGWLSQTPEPGSGETSFKATFVKGEERIIVWYYGSEDHSGQGTVPTGSRIEIIYK